MTKKTFQYNVNMNSIEYNKKHFAYCNVEQNKIANKLNELAEENQDLKSFNKDLAENLSVCANARISKDNRIERLEKENKKLKEENTRLQQCINKIYIISSRESIE